MILNAQSSGGALKSLAFTGAQSLSSSTVDGSTTVTVSSTATLVAGMSVRGTGISGNCYIVSINSSTEITINAAASATGSNSLTYGDYWVARTGVSVVDVLLVGGGGGGAGGPSVTTGGGGGGGGEIVKGTIKTSADVQVSIGDGGAGGAATSNGSSGNATTFGTLLRANGGAPGTVSKISMGYRGGEGGGRTITKYDSGSTYEAHSIGGPGGGYPKQDPFPGLHTVAPLREFCGGGGGGQGYYDPGFVGKNGGSTVYGSPGVAVQAGGGGASWGDGADAVSGTSGLSADDNTGGGGAGGYGSSGAGGDGGSGYAIVFWTE